MAPITLKELKMLVASTRGQKLPTAKALRESEREVIVEAIFGREGRLRVYESGFYSYETPDGVTVYAVDRCNGYRYENGDTLDAAALENMEWAVSLSLNGEDRLEHNQRQREENDHYTYSSDAVDGSDLRDSFDFVAAFADRDRVERMMAVLTEKQQEVVSMYFGKQMSQAEIAMKQGISQRSVSYALEAAIKKIKKYFTEYF